MPSRLLLLRKIQALDERIGEFEQELSHLPGHVAEIERQLETHQRELDSHKQALSENEKERRRLDGVTSENNEKVAKLQSQMNEARTNDQYRAFRAEIAFARKEVQKAEDQVLDKMEEAEALRSQIVEAEKALAEQAEVVAKEVEEMKGRFKGAADDLARVSAERSELAKTADAGLLRSYDHVRRRLKRRALSPVSGKRCTSCNMVVRPQLLQKLHAHNEIVQCEFCSCILYDPALDAEMVPVEDPAGDSGAA